MSNWQAATAELKVSGMTCNGCVNTVRKALEGVPGVQSADVDLAAGKAQVTYDPARTSTEAMVTAVGAAGYTASSEATGQH
jgi:copper chaperone